MSIIKRYKNNPILTKDNVPYPVATVHNAVVPEDDGTIKTYWGCADTVINVGVTKINNLVYLFNFCLNNSRKAL